MSRLMVFMLILLFVLAACARQVAGDPADTVERYIQGKADSNGDVVNELLCSEMESEITREVLSFASVEARVEDMSCSRVGNSDTVTCEGAIVATYGTEDREFPLTSYRVVQEDGEWRWCGETD